MTDHHLFYLKDVRQRRLGPSGKLEFELSVPELRIGTGHKVAIVAPSGTGKSTLVDLLVFAARPYSSGSFEFQRPNGKGLDIARVWRHKRTSVLETLRKRYVGVVLQTGGLLPFVSARRNIELPRRLLGLAEDGTVAGLAQRLDIAHLLDKLPGKLSVGERQRVAIARALAHKPALVVADEPTASLDSENAKNVMALFVELVEHVGSTLIVASHDRELVESQHLSLLQHALRRDESRGSAHATFWMD